MNALIERYADECFTPDVDPKAVEKFAHLIIQRCISEVAMTGIMLWENDETARVCSEINGRLRDKFDYNP